MNKSCFSLDTSFAIRLLTRDPVTLFERAATFLREQSARKALCSISDLVLAESYFALKYHYGFSKADALAALGELSKHPMIQVSAHARVILQLPGIASAKPGFVDRLIHGSGTANGDTLVTFEKAARALTNALVLG
jgi:predicted nucleic-acid-binding protein